MSSINFPDLMLVSSALIGSCAATFMMRIALLRFSMLDLPSARGSHSVPVVRGAGVAFVFIWAIVFAVLTVRGAIGPILLVALAGIIAVSVIGLLDDRSPVPTTRRLAVHMSGAAAAVFAATDGGASYLSPILSQHPLLPVAGILLLALATAWMINLVNFMDGIDGLAALGGAAILASAAVLPTLTQSTDPTLRPDSDAVRCLALAIATAVAGFGLVNISPWRVFMGDAGSGALGLVIAFVLIALSVGRGLSPLAAFALPATFVTDATMTLAVRITRREHPARAHRTHAYQRLVRHGIPHLVVTTIYLITFFVVVLPVAIYAQRGGQHALLALIALYGTLSTVVFMLGAGREPQAKGSDSKNH